MLQRKPKKAQNLTSGLFYSDISDHLPCFAILEYPSKIPPKPRPKIRVYNDASIQNFNRDLQGVDWSPIYDGDANPSTSFKTFLDIYKKLF